MLRLRIRELRARNTTVYAMRFVEDDNASPKAEVRGLRSAFRKLEKGVKDSEGSEAEKRARLNTSLSFKAREVLEGGSRK
jgi:hypothetical protein